MTLEARIRERSSQLGLTLAELARRIDIKQQQFSDIFSAKTGRSKHLPALAEALGVSVEWLVTGVGAFPMAAMSVREPAAEGSQELAVIGTVSAGDGQLPARWTAAHGVLRFPSRWVAVEITGNSAYPVAYPGQLALIDLDRAAAPGSLSPFELHDLHDNICLIQTVEAGVDRAYLKRFCQEPRAPQGFVLASVDSGRGSPYLPDEVIQLIAPVVGVVFEDPRKPREKGRNRADIKTPLPGG